MWLVRDKSFERVIQISKEKNLPKCYKLLVVIIIYKSKGIQSDKIEQVEDNVWFIISDTDINECQKFMYYSGKSCVNNKIIIRWCLFI